MKHILFVAISMFISKTIQTHQESQIHNLDIQITNLEKGHTLIQDQIKAFKFQMDEFKATQKLLDQSVGKLLTQNQKNVFISNQLDKIDAFNPKSIPNMKFKQTDNIIDQADALKFKQLNDENSKKVNSETTFKYVIAKTKPEQSPIQAKIKQVQPQVQKQINQVVQKAVQMKQQKPQQAQNNDVIGGLKVTTYEQTKTQTKEIASQDLLSSPDQQQFTVEDYEADVEQNALEREIQSSK